MKLTVFKIYTYWKTHMQFNILLKINLPQAQTMPLWVFPALFF